MAEERLVRFSKRGLSKLKLIIDYFDEHSPKAEDQFLEGVQLRLELLKRFPESGLKPRKVPRVRSVRIDKRRRMYYRISEKEIVVIFFWDSKLNPTKNLY